MLLLLVLWVYSGSADWYGQHSEEKGRGKGKNTLLFSFMPILFIGLNHGK